MLERARATSEAGVDLGAGRRGSGTRAEYLAGLAVDVERSVRDAARRSGITVTVLVASYAPGAGAGSQLVIAARRELADDLIARGLVPARRSRRAA
jgi:hypothetical protein